MTKRILPLVVAALLATACGDGSSLASAPSGLPGGTTRSIADNPPSNPNTALSCPSDAPTELRVVVDEFVAAQGGWKVTVDLRRVSVNIPKYLLWYQRAGSGEPVRSISLPGSRPTVTLYLSPAGVYGFRAQSSCFDGLGNLGPVVVKNVGTGSFGPDVPPPVEPPVEPPTEPPTEPPVVPVCVEACGD